MAYRDAMMAQLEGTAKRRTLPATPRHQGPSMGVPEPAAPVSSPNLPLPTHQPTHVPGELPKAPDAGPVDYQSLVMGLLKDKPYGPNSLAAIEGDLSQHGIQMQKDSGGRVRGRIKLPTGDIVDLPGAGEGNDWWSNPRAGGFTWTNRGQEGLDAGGWSFGGPSLSGSTGPMPMPPPMAPGTGGAPGSVLAGLEEAAAPSDYLQALLAQLGV